MKIDSLSVGDLSSYFLENGIKQNTVDTILAENLDEQEITDRQWKVKEAFNRIIMPLGIGMKILYFFIPFGKFISFTEEGPKYLENGYFRREKQFLISSWLGLLFYLTLILSVKFISG